MLRPDGRGLRDSREVWLFSFDLIARRGYSPTPLRGAPVITILRAHGAVQGGEEARAASRSRPRDGEFRNMGLVPSALPTVKDPPSRTRPTWARAFLPFGTSARTMSPVLKPRTALVRMQ